MILPTYDAFVIDHNIIIILVMQLIMEDGMVGQVQNSND